MVFSLHLRPYLMHLLRWRRLTHGYLTADLSYVIFTRRFPTPAQDDAGRMAQEAFLAGNCVVNWSSWVVPSVVGIVLGVLLALALTIVVSAVLQFSAAALIGAFFGYAVGRRG